MKLSSNILIIFLFLCIVVYYCFCKRPIEHLDNDNNNNIVVSNQLSDYDAKISDVRQELMANINSVINRVSRLETQATIADASIRQNRTDIDFINKRLLSAETALTNNDN